MKVQHYTFAPEVTPETQKQLLNGIESAASLDELFDVWFLQKGYRMGLGTAINDDGTYNPEAVALFFDTREGKEVCVTFISRNDLIAAYPDLTLFESFITGWTKRGIDFEMLDEQYKEWMQGMGFKETYALMGIIGPRRAAIPLMVSFALSKGGTMEAHHIDSGDYDPEDYQEDLEEEGIDLNECFTLTASIRKDPERKGSPQSIFHPFYLHKRDANGKNEPAESASLGC
ncbi:MAG: hypothetical protein RL518_390 [Pseudomonadota bacterium]|jgi:hypothetical protein